MSANITVVLHWVRDGSGPDKPGEYLIEHAGGNHEVVLWHTVDGVTGWVRAVSTLGRGSITFIAGTVVAWAKIPSVKGP